jgi:hypothetical protein
MCFTVRTGLAICLAVCLAFSVSALAADDTSLNPGSNQPALGRVVVGEPGAGIDLTPTLDITIQHSHLYHSMSITADENYYYMVNGGNADYGRVLTYDLNGNFIQEVGVNLDGRAIFYNPNDGTVYVKVYGFALYWVDPSTGANGLVRPTMFHTTQGHVGFDPSTQYLYELDEGTVYVIDLVTGNTPRSMRGFLYGGSGYSHAICTDGQHIFTWDETQVHAYDMNGNYQESFSLDYGSYGYSLSWANNRMFAADDQSGGHGYWYGYTLEDVGMACTYLSRIFCRGNNFYFKLTVMNSTGGSMSGTLTFSGYAGYGCDPGNLLVAIPRARTYPPGTTEKYYFFKVPNAVGAGQYSASVDGTLGGVDLFCCLDADIIECSPFKFGDNSAWELVEVDRAEALPTLTSLAQNYPNPFNVETTIGFHLAEAGKVSLNVYDITARLVTTLVDGQMEAGEHVVSWDASNVPSGVYFYKLTTGDYTATKKMSLLK